MYNHISEVKAQIAKQVAPNFAEMRQMPTDPDLEEDYIDRVFMQMWEGGRIIVLPKKKDLYFCGCMTMMDMYNYKCRLPIQKDEEIYRIKIWTNKRYGITRTENWRRECWDAKGPILIDRDQREADHKQSLRDKAAFGIERMTNYDTRHNRSVEIQYKLTPEQATQRHTLIRRHSVYINRLRKAIRIEAPIGQIESIKESIEAIAIQVDTLGGRPPGWTQEDATLEHIIRPNHLQQEYSDISIYRFETTLRSIRNLE